MEQHTTLTGWQYRITVQPDEGPMSPGEWDQPYELVFTENWTRTFTHQEARDVLRCGYEDCGAYPSDHPTQGEWDEEWQGTPYHAWKMDDDYAALAILDQRGPYGELRYYSEDEVLENPQWFEDHTAYNYRDVTLLGAFIDNHEAVGTDPEKQDEVLASVVETWRQYITGDVWVVTLERRMPPHECPACGQPHEEFVEYDSIGGLYGEEGVRSWLQEGWADVDIENAEVAGAGAWLL